MARMVLYFRGPGAAPVEHLAVIRAIPGVIVIEEAGGRVLLLEGDPGDILAAMVRLPSWSVAPETSYRPPGFEAP